MEVVGQWCQCNVLVCCTWDLIFCFDFGSWYTLGCWAVFCMLYLRSDFLLWFQLHYGMLLNIEQYYAGCRASCFIWCKWILEDKLTPGSGCVWIEETFQFLVRIGWITFKQSFQQVIRNRNVSPVSTYACETVGGWFRTDSHLIASYFFCSFFSLNSFLVQQVKMLCI
jgi:hypothetical protein